MHQSQGQVPFSIKAYITNQVKENPNQIGLSLIWFWFNCQKYASISTSRASVYLKPIERKHLIYAKSERK